MGKIFKGFMYIEYKIIKSENVIQNNLLLSQQDSASLFYGFSLFYSICVLFACLLLPGFLYFFLSIIFSIKE